MVLIADSGSTKADWKVVINKEIQDIRYSTKGFNPFFHTPEFIQQQLGQNPHLSEMKEKVEQVYFFGAGCSSPQRNEIIQKGLQAFFTNAKINVGHDLQGATYAVLEENEPCIISILGTGSNSAFYDGTTIQHPIPALGYVLGDEGSGTYYGKRLLASYLYGRLPKAMADDLESIYGLTRESILENVYNKPHANVYLASFARFLSNHKEYHFVKRLVYQGMLEFMDIHVCGYDNFHQYPCHFIGSISFYFEDILREVANRRQVKVGKIIKEPVHTLAEYIVKHKL